jgi:hypothetical protein
MKLINSAVSTVRLASRFVFVVCACAFLFLSSVAPASALGSYQSKPTEGTTQLLETQRRTDKAAQSAPMGLKEVQKRSNEGLNEVQGDADIDKMKTPANSQKSTSIEQEVKGLLKKVTGKDK